MSRNDYFSQLIQTNRLNHAYAFTGLNHQVKYETIHHIALELVKATIPDLPLEPMAERIQENQYADIVYIKPDGRYIRVDQIRALRSWLMTSPVEGDFKIAVITEADKMNLASQNALLTALEEPVSGVYLFLFVETKDQLLPTIQSRVQSISFKMPTLDDRIEYLVKQGLTDSQARALVDLPIEVIQPLLDLEANQREQWFKVVHYYYSLLVQSHPNGFITVQTDLKPFLTPTEASFVMVDYLLMLNGGLTKHLVDATFELNYFLTELIKKYEPSLEHLLTLHQRLLETRQKIEANVSPQLAFEVLAL